MAVLLVELKPELCGLSFRDGRVDSVFDVVRVWCSGVAIGGEEMEAESLSFAPRS